MILITAKRQLLNGANELEESSVLSACSVIVGTLESVSIVSKIESNAGTHYCNGLLENAGVNYYNSFMYPDGSCLMTSSNFNLDIDTKSSKITTAGKRVTLTSNTRANLDAVLSLEINDRDSYLYTTAPSTRSNKASITGSWQEGTSVTKDTYQISITKPTGIKDAQRFLQYETSARNNAHAPYNSDWPSPVLVYTKGGSVVRFYKDTNFTTLVYWTNCNSDLTFVYNLIPNSLYYYKVYNNSNTLITGIYSSNDSEIKSTNNYGVIHTFGLVRRLKFDNIVNARDCGGWETVDNRRFRYGVLYRGGQLDYNTNGSAYGTLDVAINTISDRKEFGKLNITTELDVRDAWYNNYGTGSNVMTPLKEDGTALTKLEWCNNKGTYPTSTPAISAYGNLHSDFTEFMFYVKHLVETAAKGKASYLHCLQGKDRTGTHAAMVMALCGVKDDGILKDYELSSFWCVNTYSRYLLLVYNFDYDVRPYQLHYTGSLTFSVFDETGNTILDKVQAWFTTNYPNTTYKLANTSGTPINDALKALTYIKSVLLEDADSEPIPVTPTPADLFVFYNYRPSESASNLVYTTPSTWKFYEILVNQGDTITITLDSPTNVVAVESANGLSSRLANGTSNITSGWTNWDFHYHDVSSDYTVLNDGYLLLIVSTSRTAIISHNSSSQPDVTPTVTCNFINSNSIPHSMTGDALTYIAPNEAVELGGNSEKPNVAHKWTYGEIPVTSGDVVRVGLNTIDVFNWEAFVESTNGLLSSIANNTKVTFDSTQAHRVTSQATGKVWDTISTGHYLYYGEHTVSSTGKLLIGIRIWNDGDPNTITPATYNGIIVKINGTSIPVTWYS